MRKRRSSLLEKWDRFRKRPGDERALILRALMLVPITAIALRMMGFRRCKELIEKVSARDAHSRTIESSAGNQMATKIARAVRSVELHGPGTPNCLERSLLLWWLLRRAGVQGELRIGARKNGSHF